MPRQRLHGLEDNRAEELLDQDAIAPFFRLSDSSGIGQIFIKVILGPQPVAFRAGAVRAVEAEQARLDLQKMVKPETGQANLDEKMICFCGRPFPSSSANSAISSPSAEGQRGLDGIGAGGCRYPS